LNIGCRHVELKNISPDTFRRNYPQLILHGRPRNILGGGGWRWPGLLHVDATVQTKIVHAEIGATVAVPPVEGGAG
jgi:hypothetical protein